jgi:hypothetical protein
MHAYLYVEREGLLGRRTGRKVNEATAVHISFSLGAIEMSIIRMHCMYCIQEEMPTGAWLGTTHLHCTSSLCMDLITSSDRVMHPARRTTRSGI